MRNRFSAGKKNRAGWAKDILLPIAMFGVIGGMFYQGLGSLDQTTEAERLRSVEQAVNKAAIQCYAIEGSYAPSLEYLENHYGLMLDREKYIFQYDVFASNIRPTILVLPKDLSMPGEETGTDEF